MSPSSAGHLHPWDPITSNSDHHTPLLSVIVYLGPVTCQASVLHARLHGVHPQPQEGSSLYLMLHHPPFKFSQPFSHPNTRLASILDAELLVISYPTLESRFHQFFLDLVTCLQPDSIHH